MKLTVVIVMVLFGFANARYYHIPEFLKYKEGQRFFLMPDDLGELHLVDLTKTEPDFRFDPEVDVQFRLFTRNNPSSYQVIVNGDSNSLTSSNYDRSKKVKIFSHGWNSNGGACGSTKDGFLNAHDVNVICIDWSKGASALYPTSVNYVPLVGQFVAKFIDWLVSQGTSVSNVHMMGHSLGGHIAGITGRNVKSGKLTYITAFDPALPLWGSNSQRIRPSDGNYVEVIHTNGGSLGLEEPVGHNDFYPNGGKSMTGCNIIDINCSHGRSVEYFANSIDHKGFMADQCKDYNEISNGQCSNLSKLHMGGSDPKAARGVFYLKTNAAKPYYQG